MIILEFVMNFLNVLDEINSAKYECTSYFNAAYNTDNVSYIRIPIFCDVVILLYLTWLFFKGKQYIKSDNV